MKILRIIYDWPPPWIGLVPQPYEITVSQAKLGHDVTVFCGRWPKAGELIVPNGVKVFPFWREPFKGAMYFTTGLMMFLKYLSWRRTNRPDIVHIHQHFGFWIYVYRKFLLRFARSSDELKIPIVAHFHITIAGRKESLFKKGEQPKPLSKYLDWPLAEKADRWAVELADAYIFTSENTKEEAIKFYNASQSKCFVVETGVNTDTFRIVGQEEREKSRADLGLDIYDKVVLNVGMTVKRKNLHLLVEALSFLPIQYKLMFVGYGSGDEDYTDELDRLIEQKGLSERVLKVGYTPYPQTPISYQLADIFVLPSSFEGLPKVVMESLACGTPVLASGFKVSENINGLNYITNQDPKSIAQEIQLIVDSKQEVDVFKVQTMYSWDVKAQQIQNIYNKVITARNASK